MKKHLRHWHSKLYQEYLKAEMDTRKAKKDLQEEIDKTVPLSSSKPKTSTLEKFWGPKGPEKYPNNSDFQRRAELDIAAYIATSNLAFQHVESESFKR